MSKYLITTIETYRVDTETEATNLIETAKEINNTYTLIKYTSEHKEHKSKGEIVDEYWKVSLVKTFNNIREPDNTIDIQYEVK